MAAPDRHADLPTVRGAELLGADRPFPGIRRETHRGAKAAVTAYDFEPGATFPLHSHPEEQITVFLAGEVEVTVDGATRTFRPQETCVVGPGVEHGMRAGPDGARFLALIVPPREHADAYRLRASDEQRGGGEPGE